MLPKLITTAAYAIAILAIVGSYSQMSALNLHQQNQSFFWSRRGTSISGTRYGNTWHPAPNRSGYDSFRGGGIGAGK